MGYSPASLSSCFLQERGFFLQGYSLLKSNTNSIHHTVIELTKILRLEDWPKSKRIIWFNIVINITNEFYIIGLKWAHRDSNPEPTDYESAALTVELWAHKRRENYIIFF